MNSILKPHEWFDKAQSYTSVTHLFSFLAFTVWLFFSFFQNKITSFCFKLTIFGNGVLFDFFFMLLRTLFSYQLHLKIKNTTKNLFV